MSLSDFDLIAMLPRSPEKRSTPELLSRLAAAGLSLTARSLQRRLVSLSASQPILCDDRNKPYGWSIAAHAPPTFGAISIQEAVALKLSERYLREAIPAEVLDDLKHYFIQADAKLKGESLYRAWLGKVRLVPAHQPLQKPVVLRQVLANAYAGVLRGRILNVTYLARSENKAKSYEIEPLAIVVRGHVTYMVAQFPWSDDVSLMALHRFKAVRVTDRKSRARLDFDLDEFIGRGGMGFMPSGTHRVHVRFYNGAGAHLEETPISATQILTGNPTGDSDLVATLPVTEQFKWWILAFAENAEVVSPAKLRTEIRDRLVAAGSRYQKVPSQ